MKSSKYSREVSQRIKTLASYVKDNLMIYDLCCDHGLIGYYASSLKNVPAVIFVDQVPHIIASLQEKIDKFSYDQNFSTICAPAETIKLPPQPVNVIIAGVYSNTILKIAEKVPLNRPEDNYIFSPNSHFESFEKDLSRLNVSVKEKLEILEKNRKFPIYLCSGNT